jgi:protein-disulfide isomerase
MAPAQGGLTRFYSLIAVAAIAGVGVIVYLMKGSTAVSIPVNVAVTAADTAGFRGYILGSDSAPVEVTEYADYQCPACQSYATVQMPSVEERLIQTGRIRLRYRDFPLDQLHRHTRVAAHSAACASEQGKYWEQHNSIYSWQPDWTTKTDAAGVFHDYAKANGLDVAKYDACMQSHKYAGRIQASLNEGEKAGVNSTPSFVVAGQLFRGTLPYDQLKHIVDSLAPQTAH